MRPLSGPDAVDPKHEVQRLMRILITNDDGIHAPGLAVLERIAAQLSDDVTVVAPEMDQSGVAHSLSVNDPLRLRKISEKRYAVKGTPTDCIIMGVKHILAEQQVDLVLSGINAGQNVAEDVTYSGTIAGAMEGTILGIPSIALSQAYGMHAYGGTGGREGIRWDSTGGATPTTGSRSAGTIISCQRGRTSRRWRRNASRSPR